MDNKEYIEWYRCYHKYLMCMYTLITGIKNKPEYEEFCGYVYRNSKAQLNMRKGQYEKPKII